MNSTGITIITDDIVQVQIPLPYILNIVNCYLLRGSHGWTLLDTGLNTAAARAQWKRAMNTLGISPADIEKIVLTHMHPDHFGMAGWWQGQTETPIPLYLPEPERSQAQVFYRRANTPLYHQWMLDCGMDRETVDDVENALLSTRDLTQPHPLQQDFLAADSEIDRSARSNSPAPRQGKEVGYRVFPSANHCL